MSWFAGKGATPVYIDTADAAALATKGRLVALLINPTGAVTPTVTVYDNASAASGTKVVTAKIVSATPLYLWFGDEGVELANGAFVNASAWTTLNVTAYVKS